MPVLLCVAALIAATTLLPPAVTAGPGPNMMGSGTALMDYDRDGDLDILFLTTQDGKVEVFRNDGLLRFTNMTATAMAGAQFNANGMGFACGDVNNDGYEDFLVTFGPFPPTSMDTPYRLFKNTGQGSFTEITRTAGLKSYVRGTLTASAAFFDYDLDGDLDLYVANYLTMVPKPAGDVDLVNAKNHFYENTGLDENNNPIFVDKTDEKGLGWLGGQSEWTLGIATGDYDNDGDIDLYLANDYGGLNPDQSIRDGDNVLFRNNGDKTFTNVTAESGTRDGGYAMGVDFGDYDNDGDLDIYLANFWEDSLLENQGDGTFRNVAAEKGIVENLNGWGVAWRDYDNDGDLDALNVNGWILNSWGQTECEGNALWENLGPAGFVNRAVESGIQDFGDARGSAYGDINRDGWIDMVVLNNTDWPHVNCNYNAGSRLLLINQKNKTFYDWSVTSGLRTTGALLPHPLSAPELDNKWVVFDFVGTSSNRSCLGVRVTVEAGGRTMMRELGAGSYMSANEHCLHFGLGNVNVIDRVTVRWPTPGHPVEVLENVAVNQRITLVQGAVPVRLVAFTAAAAGDGALIRWEFTDAVDHAGFRVHRRADSEGAFLPVSGALITGSESRGEWTDTTVEPGRSYEYRLEAVSRSGASQWFGPILFTAPLPAAARLGPNHPNPFHPLTTIPVTLASSGRAVIHVVAPTGRLVRRLEILAGPGQHEVVWDGRDEAGRSVPAGVYMYRLEGDALSGRTMTLVK